MNCLEELVALIPPPAGIKPHSEAEWAECEDFDENPFEERVGLTFFPEPGGLLYFTTDEVNGLFCWKTEGAPEDWTIFMAN